MLKVFHQNVEPFHDFKCGEIFCITEAVFKVSCCICGSNMLLDQFSRHFQVEHLSLVEECISLEDIEDKIALTNVSIASEPNPIKIEVVTDESPQKDTCLEGLGQPISVLEENSLNVHDAERDDEQNVCSRDSLIDNIVNEQKIQYGEEEKNGDDTFIKSTKRLTRSSKKKAKLLKEKNPEQLLLPADDSTEITAQLSPDSSEKGEKEKDSIEEAEFYSEVDMLWSADEKDSDSVSSENLDFKDELPFPCLICKRSYRTKHSLQKHNHRVHNPTKFKGIKRKATQPRQHACDQCEQVFRSARDLQGHKWKHTGIICDICGKTFSQTGNLLTHKIRHTGIKDFKCKECNKDFFTSKELKSHMICHTGLMPVICEVCGKRCRDRGVLTAHMRRHTGERPAKCEVCGKCFFSVHDLNVHAVAHTDARPFKCDVCGSTFQRKKALRIHKIIHSKDRKHVCKICGKSFAQSGGLNSHMRSHDAAVEKSLSTRATDAKDSGGE